MGRSVSSTPVRRRRSGARKAIIVLARKLLIVVWRMLLTGEVYRAARATTVARIHRKLQSKAPIQVPSTVPDRIPRASPDGRERVPGKRWVR